MLVNTNKRLDNAIKIIEKSKEIAVDTEFYWRRTYYPELCLIQIASDNNVFLIDTLEKLNFNKLKVIFENNNIQKIMHSASNDIPIIKRFFNCKINNIFDTQIAASFLGYSLQISLKDLIKNILNIDIQKNFQLSDWRKRPLSQQQLKYAIQDVKYLAEIKHILENKIKKNSYKKYFYQELLEIQNIEFQKSYNLNEKNSIIQNHTPTIKKNIMLISKWREEIAQQQNIPIKFIFDNKTLYAIANKNPNSFKSFDTEELKKLKPWIKKGILKTLKPHNNLKSIKPEINNKINIPSDIYDKIINFFDDEIKKTKIPPSLIASRKDIRSLTYNLIINNNYCKSKLLLGWRYELVGKKLKKYILDVINNKSLLSNLSYEKNNERF